jgi:hypothetical protein
MFTRHSLSIINFYISVGCCSDRATRQPHDQFAKQYLEELLSPFGKVEVSRQITDEVRQIDSPSGINSSFSYFTAYRYTHWCSHNWISNNTTL